MQGFRQIGFQQASRLLSAAGVLTLVAGSVLLATNVTSSAAAATQTLSLTSTAAGVTCNDASPTAPMCSGLAGGDVVNVSGANFTAGSLASIEQCNSDPTQPQILFLGNDIPVSCSALALTSISSTGKLSGTKTVATGTVGPPAVGTPTCTQTVASTTASTGPIKGCTTSGNGKTDAANFPCPPTPAQVTAGDFCVLAIGDQAGDRAIGTVLFGTEVLPTTTIAGATTTTGAGTTTTGAGATTTTAGATTTTVTGATTTTEGATTTTEGATTTTEGATTTTEGATTTTEGATTTTVGATTTTTTPAPSATITGPYELYCPGTPVGNIALNGAVTSATLSPAAPTAGQAFSVTGYQTVVNLPASLASAAAALGPDLQGTATAQIDGFPASAVTPASIKPPAITFDVPIPSPVPSAGVPLSLPSTAATVPGFTAQSPNFIVAEDSSASLSLTVAGSALSLTCTAYPNDAIAQSGITTTPPTGSPIDPVIAIAGTGSPAPTVTTTTTTKAPATSGGGGGAVTGSSKSLAFTGAGPGIGILGVIGGVLILLGFALLVLVDAPRRALASLAVVGKSSVWRRLRAGDVAGRLANLNPMGWRKSRSEGVPDTSITTPAQPQPTTAEPEATSWAASTATKSRGMSDRFSRVESASRGLAQTTARHAVRTAQWLLGR